MIDYSLMDLDEKPAVEEAVTVQTKRHTGEELGGKDATGLDRLLSRSNRAPR